MLESVNKLHVLRKQIKRIQVQGKLASIITKLALGVHIKYGDLFSHCLGWNVQYTRSNEFEKGQMNGPSSKNIIL